ncbi:MAG TPA: hypothetical protein VKS98_03180 [Chthoniobacterales bacterium]|nr:hypothetical protein [Chthoniobacterales bacterium]
MRLVLLIITAAAFADIASAASSNPALAPGATLPPGAIPSPTPPPQPAQIDRNTALILIRTTLVALQQANQTGNYSVLHAISAPGFQNANTPERLAQIFSGLRAKNFDLSGVVVLEPQLSVMPEVYQNGVMRMAGFFPSVPIQVYFDLQFIPAQGQWKLLALAVNVAPVGGAPSLEAPPAQPLKPAVAPSGSKGGPTVDVQGGKPKPSPH